MRSVLPVAVVFYGLFMGACTVFSQSLTFTTNTVSVPGSPQSLLAADINGDGKMDVVSAGGYLTVLTNNGSGGFGITNLGPLVSFARGLAVADITGDGRPDLIVVSGNLVLTIVTNNGGNFIVSTVLGYPNPGVPQGNPSDAVTADVNGDGKPDLIIANDTVPGYLIVLTNGGRYFFNIQTNYIVGNNTRGVVATDVNGDDYVDLVCANYSDGTLTVLTNNGSGIFGSNAILTVEPNLTGIVAADINSDGYPDLVSVSSINPLVGNGGVDALTILTNNGSGIFGSNATLITGFEPSGIVAADINGDGYVDLVNANWGDNTLTIFTNNGNGFFGSNMALSVGSRPVSVVAADFNGDGKLDLASVNWPDSTLTILTQTNIIPPMLSITSSGSNTVVVSWPLPVYEPSPDFALQTNSDLKTTNWCLANYPISTNGLAESITFNPLPPGNLFFRLMTQ